MQIVERPGNGSFPLPLPGEAPELSTHSKTAMERFGSLWCGVAHDSPMWPIHGRYQCRVCGRFYSVPWQESKVQPRALATVRQSRPVPVRAVLLPLAILLTVIPVLRGQSPPATIVDSTEGPSLAFARYTAGLEQATPWRLESIEIEASLPKLEKAGSLRAIRHLSQFGQPEYQVLEIAGDQTVKQQVIARYLSADVRSAAIPPSSVAITPANYRFRYKGAVRTRETVAYAFFITPRKKREGLIQGELWIDGDTGAAVRQAGYLVKRPSVLVKRVDVTRETALSEGIAGMRVTHLTIDTRLFGRAELTISERPFTASSADAVSFGER